MRKGIISFLISFLTGFLITGINIELSVIETIYTVAGILFSVGMSLIVTMNTQDVRNLEAKEIIHKQNNKLLWNYIIYFGSQTICFVLLMLLKAEESRYIENLNCQIKDITICFNSSFAFLIFCAFCISYYIWNMIATRNQIYKIEKLVEKEQMNQ